MAELITETGVVTNKDGNILEVTLAENEYCEDCSAKIFCKPKSDKKKSVLVKDTIGCELGDTVQFSLKGSSLFFVSFKFYGIPLVLMVASILLGNYLFKGNELYSIILSLSVVVVFFVIMFFVLKFSKKEVKGMPQTVLKLSGG